MKDENCDVGEEFDWEEQTLQVVSEAAKFGVPGAIKELARRQEIFDKLDKVSNIVIEEIED
jgi:hypothetical protein